MTSDSEVKNYLQSYNNLETSLLNFNTEFNDSFENDNFNFQRTINEDTASTENLNQSHQQVKPNLRGHKSDKWDTQEIKKYELFCLQNFHILKGDHQTRKKEKIFKKMGEFIGTRSSKQCKSHNQKCFKKFQDNLIAEYGQNFLKFLTERNQNVISNSSNNIEQTQIPIQKQINYIQTPFFYVMNGQYIMLYQVFINNNSAYGFDQENKRYLDQSLQRQYYPQQQFTQQQFTQPMQYVQEQGSCYNQIPQFEEKQSQTNYEQQPVFSSQSQSQVNKQRRRNSQAKK